MPDIASLVSQAPDGGVLSDPYTSSYQNNNLQAHGLEAVSDAIPCHPLGVKPSGNALLASWDLRMAIGTFRILPDELILILLEFLDGSALLSIGRTCKAFYAFTRAEELWKALFIR